MAEVGGVGTCVAGCASMTGVVTMISVATMAGGGTSGTWVGTTATCVSVGVGATSWVAVASGCSGAVASVGPSWESSRCCTAVTTS
ncbi:hypothetical protein BXZ70DRAFT_923898 [Cristinia sonorae]|uniref:Uncharacterized protein n=1 Tax=Cristinia sonorae TaxID=1940300 RepID=A0A8K0UV06_9AGAR|nr:hypothetical protein BXZ70DRAFT_923898 [Cristinia sonorae]